MEAAIYSFSLRGAELAKRIEAVLSDLDYSVSVNADASARITQIAFFISAAFYPEF